MLTHLHIVQGCFHATVAELSRHYRDHMAYRAENTYNLALYRKKHC